MKIIEDKLYIKKPKKGVYSKNFIKDYLQNYSPTTYSNKECTYVQCRSGAHRSFSDLYRLTKTYYPSITEEKFAKIIYRITQETGLNFIYCVTIDKNVAYYYKKHNKEKLHKKYKIFLEGKKYYYTGHSIKRANNKHVNYRITDKYTAKYIQKLIDKQNEKIHKI